MLLMVSLINLFFVPMLPLYLHYRRENRPIRLCPELVMEYCIAAVCLVPVTKAVLFVPGRLLHDQIYIYSGYYTVGALIGAWLLPRLSVVWKKLPGKCRETGKALAGRMKDCFQSVRVRRKKEAGGDAPAVKWSVLDREPGPDWRGTARAAYYAYRIILLALMSLLFGLALLILAAGTYSEEVLAEYFRSWEIIALNTLPVALLALLLYGVIGRAWCAFLLSGGTALVLSMANFYKLSFRDEPLYFENLLLFREAANMASSGYELFLTKDIVLVMGLLLLMTPLLYFLAPGRLRRWKGRTAAAVAAVLLSAALVPAYASAEEYDSLLALLDRYASIAHPAERYAANGCIYPFLHSVGDVADTPVPGYSAGKAEELLSAYLDADIPDGRKISVIAIMREAYTDFSQYGIPGLDPGVYEPYHALEAESYTGNMVANTFAGGTVNAERGFLSGNYQLRNFQSNANSYVWYMREQGYSTEGSHPYFGWFYNRNSKNAYLGFENYRFYEDGYQEPKASRYVEDSILLSEIYQDFQKNKSTGKPYFSFSVTMQSHGPYPTDTAAPAEYLTGPYSEECRNAMNHYLSITSEMDCELVKLVEQLRLDPEPVVLVTFGDHMPWMGDGNAFYREMGVNMDTGEEEGFYRFFSTRYLIWANDAAKAVLGHDVQGEGPSVSPCYLMNLVFQQLDWEGPAFMQAMDDMMEVFPVVSTVQPSHYVVDGAFSWEIPENRKEMFQQFLFLQKYWRNSFLF